MRPQIWTQVKLSSCSTFYNFFPAKPGTLILFWCGWFVGQVTAPAINPTSFVCRSFDVCHALWLDARLQALLAWCEVQKTWEKNRRFVWCKLHFLSFWCNLISENWSKICIWYDWLLKNASYSIYSVYTALQFRRLQEEYRGGTTLTQTKTEQLWTCFFGSLVWLISST